MFWKGAMPYFYNQRHSPMKIPSRPALWSLYILLAFACACHSRQTLSDTDRRILEDMTRRADSFPDRAVLLSDSAVRLASPGENPDTLFYRIWIAKAKALFRMRSVSGAMHLLDSTAALAEANAEWAALGRISLLSAQLMLTERVGAIGYRHDKFGYCREAVRAFDKVDRRLEKAEALSLLGYVLPELDPRWAVDTLVLAADIFLEENGSRKEYLSCVNRIGFHSLGLGNPQVTREYLEKALRISRSTPDSPLVAPLTRFYAISMKGNRPDSALYFFDLADRLDSGVVDKLSYYREGLFEKSDILMQQGRLAQAARDLQGCLTFALSENRWPLAARTEFKLGECAYQQGDKAASGNHYRNSLSIADTNANASFFRKTALQRYLAYGMVMGDSSLTRRLRAKLSALDDPTSLREGAAVEPGVVRDVPPRRDEDILPRWLNKFIDAHPILLRFLGFGLLVALVGVVLLNRRNVGLRIKSFESYQRVLTEGRIYRVSMFAGHTDGSSSAGLNRKALVMHRLDEWLLSAIPFRDPDFGTEQMVRHLGVSHADLNEAVKSHVDVNAATYLDHIRIEHSISLMKDPTRKGLSMSDIAKEAGCKRLREFRRLFYIVTKVSAGRYRSYCRSTAK